MKIEQFVKCYQPKMTQYCPVVITSDGNIFESTAGHMQTMISLSGDQDIMSHIPKDVSPLLYLAGKLSCVIVDYENQIYLENITSEQQEALTGLVEAGLITNHQIRMTHEAIKL